MPSGMVVDVDEDNGEAMYTINEFEIEPSWIECLGRNQLLVSWTQIMTMDKIVYI